MSRTGSGRTGSDPISPVRRAGTRRERAPTPIFVEAWLSKEAQR